MAFGQQSGPPASTKQVAYLQALLRAAGYADFREARHPLGLTQRQAAGKFSSSVGSALIDHLVGAAARDETASASASGGGRPPPVAVDRRLADVTDEVLANELRRRGWEIRAPTTLRSA